MEPSEDRHLNAVLKAWRGGTAASVADVWRQLAPNEQEAVLFRLLATHAEAGSETVEPEAGPDLPVGDLDATAAMAVVEETEVIPKLVEDLRGLTGAEGDDQAVRVEQPAVPNEYWSRWLRRWKISALVAAWVVTTVFAFTANTSTFGPMEWVVAVFGTVVLGGAFVGTLVNFAVAAISTRADGPTANN